MINKKNSFFFSKENNGNNIWKSYFNSPDEKILSYFLSNFEKL